MWVHTLNPILLSIGSLEIRWYGLVYVFGALFSLWWLLRLQKQGALSLSEEEVWDFIFSSLLGILIGARLFMLIWEPSTYLSNPLRLVYLWEGGMSFHGGFVGIIGSAFLFCRRKSISFLRMADFMSFPTMLALALGRLANFMNGELVGRAWDGAWCVLFPGETECRHPSTLYAAAKRFAIAAWLYVLSIKSFVSKFKAGFLFWNFMLLEGTGRFLVDFFREDLLYAGLSLGQWMSLVMIIVAGTLLIVRHVKDFQSLWGLVTQKT